MKILTTRRIWCFPDGGRRASRSDAGSIPWRIFLLAESGVKSSLTLIQLSARTPKAVSLSQEPFYRWGPLAKPRDFLTLRDPWKAKRLLIAGGHLKSPWGRLDTEAVRAGNHQAVSWKVEKVVFYHMNKKLAMANNIQNEKRQMLRLRNWFWRGSGDCRIRTSGYRSCNGTESC